MNLKELIKRFIVAGVAIPIVCFCVVHPIFMNLITVTLSFVGTIEWILLRRHIMKHYFDLSTTTNSSNYSSSSGTSGTSGEKSGGVIREEAFPRRAQNWRDRVQVYVRGALSAILPLVAYFYFDRPFYVLAGIIAIYVLMFVCTIFGWMNSGMSDFFVGGGDKTKISPQQHMIFDMVALALDFFGILYTGFNLAAAIFILRQKPILLLLILFANWAADAFAMFAGKRLGRHKLCPSLSPNKTVEGAVGAVVGAVLLSLAVRLISVQFGLFSSAASPLAPVSTFVYNGILLGILGIVGDLLESFYKRVAVIKDSGDFFGAHGGVLDRIDGLLFSFPVMYIVLELGFF